VAVQRNTQKSSDGRDIDSGVASDGSTGILHGVGKLAMRYAIPEGIKAMNEKRVWAFMAVTVSSYFVRIALEKNE